MSDAVEATRKSRIIMCNEYDRRYELEMEENINYMLSNNFMLFFSFVCQYYFFFSWICCFLLWRITASPENMTESKIIIFDFRWSYPVSYWARIWFILRRYGCMLILVIKQPNLLSLTALTSTRLHCEYSHRYSVAVRTVKGPAIVTIDNNEQVQNMHQHALCTLGPQEHTRHMPFYTILEMNSTSKWSA